MLHAYGGSLTNEQIEEISNLFASLAVNVTDKHIRKDLEKLNRHISDMTGGVVPFVNWNS